MAVSSEAPTMDHTDFSRPEQRRKRPQFRHSPVPGEFQVSRNPPYCTQCSQDSSYQVIHHGDPPPHSPKLSVPPGHDSVHLVSNSDSNCKKWTPYHSDSATLEGERIAAVVAAVSFFTTPEPANKIWLTFTPEAPS